MAEANESEWLNVCVDCGFRLTTHGIEDIGQCPECAKKSKSLGWRWLCHLVNNSKPKQKNRNGDVNKNSEGKIPEGIIGQFGILSQQNSLLQRPEPQIEGIYETSPRRGRGRPLRPVPRELIKQLANQGLSSRAIAKDLAQRGFHVSYKTVQRILSSERQGSLL